MTIFLLDCCREYYLRDSNLQKLRAHTRSTNLGTSQVSGLREMYSRTGSSIIAFACEPGAIASEIEEGRNGLFTKHLLRHIETANEDIRMILADVTDGVIEESQNKQRPYCHSVLRHKRIYLCDQVSGNDLVKVRLGKQ